MSFLESTRWPHGRLLEHTRKIASQRRPATAPGNRRLRLEPLESRRMLSAAPDFEWIRQFGNEGPARDSVQAVGDDGNVYVGGSTGGALPGQTRLGGGDAFVRKYDSDGTEVWTSQFGSSSGDQALSISVDASGVYVAGLTGGALPGQTSAGGTDAFVRKYDLDGTELWTRQFGTSSTETATSISAGAGGVYVAGTIYSAALPGQISAGGADAFVRKYESDGTELWTRQFGSSSFEESAGVSVNASGDVCVVGTTGGALPGQTSAGGVDTFVRKYYSDGTVAWTRQFGSKISDWAFAAAMGVAGDVYVGGTGAIPGQPYAGGSADAFVRKYNSDGTELWTRQFGTPSSEQASGISVGASGVYVAGVTGGTLPGQTSAGNTDTFVRKYDLDGTELWTRQFGGSGHDQGLGVSADASGNVSVAGFTNRTLPGQTSAGLDDAFVRRYDSDGVELWTRQFGSKGPASDVARAVDVGGNIYVAGSTNGAFPGQTHVGGYDAFVRKYDSSGTELWTRQFGSSLNDQALGVSVDTSGVYVTGWAGGTLPGQTNAGSGDAFVRKYDSDGAELWTRQFGSSGNDQALGVSVEAYAVYVTGWTGGTFPGQTNSGNRDAFIRKYDSSGNQVWTRQFGTSSDDRASGISVDASGVYVTGSTDGTLPGQAGVGYGDAFVRMYDSNGNQVWTRQFGTSSQDFALGISVDASGIYVNGATYGVFSGQTSAGSQDAFVRKYDSAGTEVWTRQFGSSSSDLALSISVDNSGVYVAGFVLGALPGQTSAGGYDAFARKYDLSGDEIWTRQFGTPGNDWARGISVDASGDVYVVGSTGGTLPGQTSAGGGDLFIAKLPEPAMVKAVDVGDNLQSWIVKLNDVDLDFTQATDASNYRVTVANGDANGDGDPFNDDDEDLLDILDVLYNPTLDQITVKTVHRFFDDYFRLELDGDDLNGPDWDGLHTPGIIDLNDNFLEGGDYTTVLDLTSLSLVDSLLTKVEDLGLSTGAENGLTSRLEAAVRLMGEEVDSDRGVLALLDAFRRGVQQWYTRDEITAEERDDLFANTDLITSGFMLSLV